MDVWSRVQRFATTRLSLAAFLAAVAFSAWFFLGPYAAMGEHGITDERFGIGPDGIRSAIDGMGPSGRDAYGPLLAADLVFALLHVAWMVGFIAIGTKRWKGLPRQAMALPAIALVFDWIENAAFFVLLAQHPDTSHTVAVIAAVALHAKFAAYAAAVVVMAAIVGWMVVHPVQRVPRHRR